MAALPPSLPHCRFTMRGFNVVRQGSELSMRLKGFRQYAASLDAAEPEPHRIWILKPLGGFNQVGIRTRLPHVFLIPASLLRLTCLMSPVSRQVGIHMYSMDTSETESESATKEWVLKHVPEGQWVLQEYVMNPMTFQGHKFDLRIWAIWCVMGRALDSARRGGTPHPSALTPLLPLQHVARPAPRLPDGLGHPQSLAVEVRQG